MSKLVRLDEDHFAYLTDRDLTMREAQDVIDHFNSAYLGKRLVVLEADDFVDRTRVNIPAYEAAIDALTYFTQAFEGTGHGDSPHAPDEETGICRACRVIQEDAYDTAREVLRRLRDEVPA